MFCQLLTGDASDIETSGFLIFLTEECEARRKTNKQSKSLFTCYLHVEAIYITRTVLYIVVNMDPKPPFGQQHINQVI